MAGQNLWANSSHPRFASCCAPGWWVGETREAPAQGKTSALWVKLATKMNAKLCRSFHPLIPDHGIASVVYVHTVYCTVVPAATPSLCCRCQGLRSQLVYIFLTDGSGQFTPRLPAWVLSPPTDMFDLLDLLLSAMATLGGCPRRGDNNISGNVAPSRECLPLLLPSDQHSQHCPALFVGPQNEWWGPQTCI